MQYDLIVIGGGPAGLVAAGSAAAKGVKTLLLERMPRIGTKLRITGKGRCNITNARPIETYLPFLHGNVPLAQNALRRFTNQQVVELLNAEGLQTILERGYILSRDAQPMWQRHSCVFVLAMALP